MANHKPYYPIIVEFRKLNGVAWSEEYSSRLLSLFKKCKDTYRIIDKNKDKIIYERQCLKDDSMGL